MGAHFLHSGSHRYLLNSIFMKMLKNDDRFATLVGDCDNPQCEHSRLGFCEGAIGRLVNVYINNYTSNINKDLKQKATVAAKDSQDPTLKKLEKSERKKSTLSSSTG
jgi:hypothetical protein